MKWNIKRSEELKMQIAENEKLVLELSKITKSILEKNKIELKGYSYILEPRVFELVQQETPEIALKARVEMAKAIVDDFYEKEMKIDPDILKYIKCLPECGIVGPRTLEWFEKLRIIDYRVEEVIYVQDSITLINNIVQNKSLLNELSNSVFSAMEAHGIKLEDAEDCIFTPFVFKTPAFAQKIATPERAVQLKGFGPQVIADPQLHTGIEIKPLPGIIERGPGIFIPSVVVDRWWWVGIPAPEMLVGLDRIREMRF